MTVDNYVAIFRCYSDMTIFIIGHIDDNELILGMLLDCMHECFDRIFRKGIERKSLIENMSGVILVIDELLDSGIIMHLEPTIILARIDTKAGKGGHSAAGDHSSSSTTASSSSATGGSSSGGGSGLFASVFSSARSQLAKSMGMH